jgi:selenocysteine lyase/cysteine desulfurase
VAPFAVATAGIRLINGIGTGAVLAHNRTLTRMLIDAVDPACLRSPPDDAGRTGTVVLDFGERQADMAARLRAAGVRFDIRPTGMRLSPHVYNSAAEMETVIDCLGC